MFFLHSPDLNAWKWPAKPHILRFPVERVLSSHLCEREQRLETAPASVFPLRNQPFPSQFYYCSWMGNIPLLAPCFFYFTRISYQFHRSRTKCLWFVSPLAQESLNREGISLCSFPERVWFHLVFSDLAMSEA